MKWFKNIRTAEGAKARYRELVKRHHPDAGGDPEELLAIKAEYEAVLERILVRSFDNEFRSENNIPKADKKQASSTAAPEPSKATHQPAPKKKVSIFDVFNEDEKEVLRSTAAKAVGRAAESLADRFIRKIIR